MQGTPGTWRWEVCRDSRPRPQLSPAVLEQAQARLGVITSAAAGALVGQEDRWDREPGGPAD